MFPKTKRIIDPQAIINARRSYCQYCGISASSVYYAVHHITYRSQGGHDSPDNLICLCQGPGSNNCHEMAHSKHISKDELLAAKEIDEWR